MSETHTGEGARSQVAAATLADGATEASTPDAATSEPVKGISLRLPLSMWKQVSTLSHERQLAKGGKRRKRRDADEDSIHGILLTALREYLERSR